MTFGFMRKSLLEFALWSTKDLRYKINPEDLPLDPNEAIMAQNGLAIYRPSCNNLNPREPGPYTVVVVPCGEMKPNMGGTIYIKVPTTPEWTKVFHCMHNDCGLYFTTKERLERHLCRHRRGSCTHEGCGEHDICVYTGTGEMWLGTFD